MKPLLLRHSVTRERSMKRATIRALSIWRSLSIIEDYSIVRETWRNVPTSCPCTVYRYGQPPKFDVNWLRPTFSHLLYSAFSDARQQNGLGFSKIGKKRVEKNRVKSRFSLMSEATIITRRSVFLLLIYVSLISSWDLTMIRRILIATWSRIAMDKQFLSLSAYHLIIERAILFY